MKPKSVKPISKKAYYSAVAREEMYLKFYQEGAGLLRGIPGAAINIFNGIAHLMNYDSVAIINAGVKDELGGQLGIKRQSVDNYIKLLVGKELLYRTRANTYFVNPLVCSRNTWAETLKLRLQLRINPGYNPMLDKEKETIQRLAGEGPLTHGEKMINNFESEGPYQQPEED
jgi:hypothetical protein